MNGVTGGGAGGDEEREEGEKVEEASGGRAEMLFWSCWMELARDAGLEMGEVVGLVLDTDVKGEEGEKMLVLGSVLKAC